MTQERTAADSALDDALLDQILSEAGFENEALHAGVRPRRHAGPVALSFGQELLWLLDRASPGLTAYNVAIARRVRGPLDAGALERGLNTLVARHEILRTRFSSIDGHGMQVVDAAAPLVLRVFDVRHLDPVQREIEAARAIEECARTPFDLATEHPFRAALVRIDEFDHALLLETHHIACDGWSIGVLLRELSAAYRALRAGVEPDLRPPSLQYADYAAWQRQTIAGPALERLMQYWRGELGDPGEPLDLPTDYPRAKAPTFAGVQRSLEIAPELAQQLKAAMLATGMTPHMALLAAFATVLHRYTGRTSIAIGSNVAARAEEQFDGVIGYFNKTLPLRINVSGDLTLAELLRRVRASSLGAYDHQEIPIEQLALELQRQRPEFAPSALFDVVLTAMITTPSPLELEGAAVEPFGVDLGATKFDLTLFSSDSAAGLRLILRARSDLWGPQWVDRCLGHVEQVLRSLVADPSITAARVPLLTCGERAELAAWNATATSNTPPSVVELIASAIARVPGRVAVCFGEQRITYAELGERARRLAGQLRAAGVRPGALVGLLLERSIDAVVALVAIWQAQAAYVPLALDAPQRHIGRQLAEIDCRCVVTSAAHAALVDPAAKVVLADEGSPAPESTAKTVLADEGSPAPDLTETADERAVPAGDSLAYVLFTSGTSGVAKAVAVSHANLTNYVHAIARIFTSEPGGEAGGFSALGEQSFGLVSTLSADLGHTVLFPALCAGATLRILPADIATDAGRFAAYARAHPIDVLKITPSHFRALVAGAPAAEDAPSLLPRRWLVIGGEQAGWDVAAEIEQLRSRAGATGCRVLNHYGPTETTVGATVFELTPLRAEAARGAGAQSVPIGAPLANVTAYVCDQNGELLPVGIPGELYVGGAGVAQGYLNEPHLTAERFVTRAGLGRVYRTGDRVRRLPNGDLEFLGRTDLQVKVRGYRVEPSAIEAALATHPGVAHVAVDVREEPAGNAATLVAYVVAKPGLGCTAATLDSHAADELAPHERPSRIVLVERLPLTNNGKLDRRALAGLSPASAPQPAIPPRTPTETSLRAIWSESFKRDPAQIGVTADFFELGGHSLLAIRVLGKVARVLGVRLALRTLFELPTIERLAVQIDTERARGAGVNTDGIVPVARAAYRVERGPGVPPVAPANGDSLK